jgi:ubiquinone biosynthesis protein
VRSLKLGHLSRYGELARLLLAHRGALGCGTAADPAACEALERDAERLVCELEEMGPTFVKLGQLLSSRVDLLPEPYTVALGSLQDRAAPVPFDVVRHVAEEELGTRLSAVFTRVDHDPLGSASLAQVHRAVLRDGRAVAVKVQRPGIRARILDDMDVIGELAATFDEHVGSARRANLAAMVDEFRRALLDELDYRHEAANLLRLGQIVGPYDRLAVPSPVEEHSTARLLVMDLVEGVSVGSLGTTAVSEDEGELFVSQLFKAYLDQILLHGVYHADPHPGNVVLTFDRRLALLDVGMTGHVAPDLREALLRLLVALGEGRGSAVATALERAGERLDDFDRHGLQRDVSSLVTTIEGADLQTMEAGRQLAELARVALRHGLRPAPELSMVGKALLNLDDVARRLAPAYEPAVAIREHTASLTREQLLSAASPSRLVSAALDAKELAERFPDRMNRLLESLADGRIHIRVEGMDEREIMRSVQKLANRAAAGLAVAALVLGAAIFSVSPLGPRWWGLSAFTVVLLGLAAVIGAAIILSTVRNDLPQRRALRDRFRGG